MPACQFQSPFLLSNTIRIACILNPTVAGSYFLIRPHVVVAAVSKLFYVPFYFIPKLSFVIQLTSHNLWMPYSLIAIIALVKMDAVHLLLVLL